MFWTLDLITFNKISPLSDKESYLLSSQYRSLNKKEQALLESARVYLRRIKCVYAVSEDYATRRGRFQEKRKKNFWDNDVSDVNLSLKLWPVFLLLWDLRWNPPSFDVCFHVKTRWRWDTSWTAAETPKCWEAKRGVSPTDSCTPSPSGDCRTPCLCR